MARELNPELFGEKRVAPEPVAYTSDVAPEASFLDIDRQMFELKSHFQRLDETDRKVQSQVAEFAKGISIKVEKLQQLIHRLEGSHNGLAQEIAQRLTGMQQKIVERASYDEKTQEMMDRHNKVIRSFEARMSQMQKVLQEKEALMMSTLVALNEAKAEIARLKRL